MNRFLALIAVMLFLTAGAAAQAAGVISGKVVFGDERAGVHNVSVRIAELNRTLNTDGQGSFIFPNVPPGRYTVHAHLEGFGDKTETVDVAAGGTAAIEIELSLAAVREQVTVTASGSEQSTFEAIESVSTLDSTQITARASIGLGEILDQQPGVSKRSSGPGTSRPVIRGFDGDRVLVSTDGVRVGSLASQSGDHSEPVDALSAERIEIVKGPATLLYGSNAIGGVVNAISGHDEGAHPGLRGHFTAVGGTNNSQAAVSGAIEYGTGRWMFWGNGSGQRTGDYTAGGDFGEVENTFTRNAAVGVGLGYYTDKLFVNANYNYYQSRYGIPLDFREAEPELREIPVHRHNLKVNLGYNDAVGFVSSMKFTVDLSRYKHQEIADGEVGTTFRNDVFSYRAMFEQKPYGRLSGRFGFEGYRRDFSTVGEEVLVDGPVRQDSFSVFGLEEIKFERVKLQFGARVEHNSYSPSNPELLPRSFTGFSGAAGVRFDLWKGGAFVANYTHAYRAPALEELYNFGPHDGTLTFEIGDPLLEVEKNNGVDLSLRQQNKRVKAEANFYYYDIGNFIFLAPTGETDKKSGFPIAEYLQGDSRFFGTELSLDVEVTKYLNVLAGFDYVNAELKTGLPLPRIAPLRGRVGLDLHFKNASIRPEFVAVGRQDRVFTGETSTAGYGVFNIDGSYVISRTHFAHVFGINAYNLTDKLYFNHISFIKDISPAIGRGVRFTYTIRFF